MTKRKAKSANARPKNAHQKPKDQRPAAPRKKAVVQARKKKDVIVRTEDGSRIVSSGPLPMEVKLGITKEAYRKIFPQGMVEGVTKLWLKVKKPYRYTIGIDVTMMPPIFYEGAEHPYAGISFMHSAANLGTDDKYLYQEFTLRDGVEGNIQDLMFDPEKTHVSFVDEKKWLEYTGHKDKSRNQGPGEKRSELNPKHHRSCVRRIEKPDSETIERVLNDLIDEFCEALENYCKRRYSGPDVPQILYKGVDKRFEIDA